MNCTQCNDPKVSYISAGVARCTCGGVLDLSRDEAVKDLVAQDRDPRPMALAPSWTQPIAETARKNRRRILTRFTRTLGNEMFECGCCNCVRAAASMMRFADNEATVQTSKTDWCGICVKDAVKETCATKGDFKRVWAMIKDGVILPEHMLNSSEYVRPDPIEEPDRKQSFLGFWKSPEDKQEKRAPRKPAGPPPELDLVV